MKDGRLGLATSLTKKFTHTFFQGFLVQLALTRKWEILLIQQIKENQTSVQPL